MAGYIGANTSSVTNNQNAAERRKKFTFTTNTTVLSGLNFLPDKIHIFHNGIRLVKTTDYTEAADGKSVTLVNAAQAGDEVVAVTFDQNPASGGGGSSYTDADVDAHLLTAGVTLDATNDRVGFGIAAPTAPIHIEAPDNTELMNFTVTGNEKWALKGASGVGSDDYVSFGISGGNEAVRWHEAGHVIKPNQPIFSANRGGKSNLTAAQVIDWTVIANQGNHFSTSTNRFTCPIAGKYYCSFFSLTHTSNTSAASSVAIRKNGTSSFSAYSDTVSTVNYLSYSAAGLFDCAANDLLDFYNSSGNVYGGVYSGAVIYLVG